MSSFFLKKLLQKTFFFLCKTIELVSFISLKLYKNKNFSSKKIIHLFFFFFKKNDLNHFFIYFMICHLFTSILYFSDINDIIIDKNSTHLKPIHHSQMRKLDTSKRIQKRYYNSNSLKNTDQFIFTSSYHPLLNKSLTESE